jgi:N-acyl-D-amino-acid deacylase
LRGAPSDYTSDNTSEGAMTTAGIRVLRYAGALLLAAATLCSAQVRKPRFDVVICNGTVFDGTGAPGVREDVGIISGYIAAVGNIRKSAGHVVIDASGLFVAPGFINVHDHSQRDALPTARNMLLQGVTTSIINPDGFGPTDIAAQLADIASRPLAINVGASIGFNAVWKAVIGLRDRRASAAEIARMQRLIVRNMRNGAWDVSAGLDYKPAYYATTSEVVQVVGAATPWRTVFPNHERLTPETNFSSHVGMAETIEIAERAGLGAEITHMKVQGHEQGSADENLAMMSAATAEGHYTTADVYPYLAGQGIIAGLIIPAWAVDGGEPALLQRLKNPVLRAKIARDSERAMNARFGGAKGVFVMDIGKELTEVMKEQKVSPGEAIARMVEEGHEVALLRFGREDDLLKILRYPLSAIACDCGASLRTDMHPRYWGTWSRVLGRYVREERLLTWQDAVRKMTGLPATMLGMVDRGYVAPGMVADITVFDPRTVIDRATYDRPAVRPEGVRFVLVNGAVEVKDGGVTGRAAGRTLLRASYMASRQESSGSRTLSASGIVHPAAEGAESAAARISFHVSQTAKEGRAQGYLRIEDGQGHSVLKAYSLGLLQTSRGWASFTAYGIDHGRDKAVSVVVDELSPAKPGAKNVYVREAGKTVYEGVLRKVSLPQKRASAAVAAVTEQIRLPTGP